MKSIPRFLLTLLLMLSFAFFCTACSCDDDDDDNGPPIVNCVPPLDYDGDGNNELLLSVWIPDEDIQRLYLVDPGTYERGEPVLEYGSEVNSATFDTADFDGNGIWDIVVYMNLPNDPVEDSFYEVYMNGDFSTPAHTFGPYTDSSGWVEFMDTDGNGLPEMMITTQGSSKAAETELIQVLIDSDNDFSEIATFQTPVSATGGELNFLPERRVGDIWPMAGSITGNTKAPELLAYSHYQVGLAYYVRFFIFNATDGSLVFESSPYYAGDTYNSVYPSAADVDGDGQTEAVLAYTEQIEAPPSSTAYMYILGGPELAPEWTGTEYAESSAWSWANADYNLDGILEPTFGRLYNNGDNRTITALNGTNDFGELFQYESTTDDQYGIETFTGRGDIEFGFDYRGLGTEVFLTETVTDGLVKTGYFRAIDLSNGSITGRLQEFNLGETGTVYGKVQDFGGDSVLDLVVFHTEKYAKGTTATTVAILEILAAPGFSEVFHEQLPDGFSYNVYTEYDLTGDSIADLLLRRTNSATSHQDYLLYDCDSSGCADPVQIDYEANEQFYFFGPML
jgi:hypothetical protein